MENNGHEMFPELVENPNKKSSNVLGDLMQELRHKKREEMSACIAAKRARQQKEADFHLSDTEDYFPDDIRDARVSGHTTCKLLELPPDILNLIVDHSLPHNGSWGVNGQGQTYTSALKHLRLIHPCFAYLRLLLTRLFGSLILRADPDQLSELGEGTDRIAPFVKKVTFCTVEVKRSELPRRRQFDRADEIRRAMGRRIKRLHQEGTLLATWSNFVKQCPNLSSFSLGQGLNYELVDLGPEIQTMVAIMIKTILAADKRPRSITIDYIFDREKIWSNVPEWKDLNLTELEEFNLSLFLCRKSHKFCAPQAAIYEACSLLSHVLQASSGSLRKLTTVGDALGALVEMNVPEGDHIRELYLNSFTQEVDPVRLGKMIADFHGLKKLHFNKLIIKPNHKIQQWHPIFAAIRDHAIPLHVEIIGLHIETAIGPDWGLTIDIHLPETPCRVETDDTVGEAITKMIRNFLSRHGQWYSMDS